MHREADVAVLPLLPDKDDEIQHHLQQHFLPVSALLPERKAPERNSLLTVLGFPLGLGVEREFSPIRRETKAASGLLTLPRADVDTPATFFVIQDPSIGGYSGAPVLETLGGVRVSEEGIGFGPASMRVVGMIHGTVSDQSGGLGAVTPSAFIIETMQRDAAGSGESFTTGERPFVLRRRYVEPGSSP